MKTQYDANADISDLLRDSEVHRDVYISPDIFRLEMERLWKRTWLYVGHASQVPNPGDYFTTTLATQPVVMVRHTDGEVHVVMNRCAHKGAKVVSDCSGNVGKFFRCPYHAWTFKTNGELLAIPLRKGYEDTGFEQCDGARGLARVAHVRNYRGFVFARLDDEGPDFEEFFGESLSSIDNMCDRSPEGELEVAGGVLRYMHDCNWKIFLENLNDTMHPMVAHESAAGTAKAMWTEQPADAKKPMAVELFVPFAEGYAFSDEMGVRVLPHGHSYTGVGSVSLHSGYSDIPEYEEKMHSAYGSERAHEILGMARHNTVYYPSLTIKGVIQAIRVIRPISENKTLIESWTFRLKGAPEKLLQRTVMYTRLINSPMSVVGHDDMHVYQCIQEGLQAQGNDWVSLHRGYSHAEIGTGDFVCNGTSEISMRNQFRAWKQYMSNG
ncbi:Anthranilate 1,2-dioxygenase large subunit [compost metagenome]